MLTRKTYPNGVVLYHSSILAEIGIPHAFTTRIGGVSAGSYHSLNLGNPTEATTPDPNENLQENYRRVQEALGAPDALRAWVQQIHSNYVELIEAEGEAGGGEEYAETLEAEIRDRFHGQTQADALLTDQTGVLLTVRVADCVPVLLASADARVVAAVHAGWRGVVKGILPRTLRAFAELGVPVPSIVAAIGPSISARHFEVGPEVAADFVAADLKDAIVETPGAKPHIDMAKALALQLQRACVRKIDLPTGDALCTFANAQDFYSHRRDQGLTGRQAAVIMRPLPPNPEQAGESVEA